MRYMKNKKSLEKTKKSQKARSHLWTPFWVQNQIPSSWWIAVCISSDVCVPTCCKTKDAQHQHCSQILIIQWYMHFYIIVFDIMHLFCASACWLLCKPQRCWRSSLQCVVSKLYHYHFFFYMHTFSTSSLSVLTLTIENDDETASTTQGDDDLTLKGLTMTLSADIWTKTQVSHKQLLINIHDFYCSFCLCSWLRD